MRFLWRKNNHILIQTPPQFVHKDSINDKSALFQVVTGCRTGTKLLSKPMMTQFTSAFVSPGFNELTHWPPTRCSCNLTCNFQITYQWLIYWGFLMKLSSGKCQLICLMVSQHWFSYGLGTVRHIYLYQCDMVSLGSKSLINVSSTIDKAECAIVGLDAYRHSTPSHYQNQCWTNNTNYGITIRGNSIKIQMLLFKKITWNHLCEIAAILLPERRL